MLHYNQIQEGQQVKYFGHTCKVVEKNHKPDGMYHITMTYPNPLMMDVTCFAASVDGNFEDISPC